MSDAQAVSLCLSIGTAGALVAENPVVVLLMVALGYSVSKLDR